MPTTPHIERHFTATETVRNIVIGMSDGLTVPFALAAGLSGTVVSPSIIVIAGLAEIAAGAIAMGLGGYLAAKTDSQHYTAERRRELRETQEIPTQELEEVAKVFRRYGLNDEQVALVVAAISSDPARWVDFMMRFELDLQGARSVPRLAQRFDHLRFVHCGGDDPVESLHDVEQCSHSALGFGWGNAHSAVHLRVRQGTLYRDQPAARRTANRLCWWIGGGSDLRHCPVDRVVPAISIKIRFVAGVEEMLYVSCLILEKS